MTHSDQARFSHGLLASAVAAGSDHQKCVRDLGTETRIGSEQMCATPEESCAQDFPIVAHPHAFCEAPMNIWTEFKNAILPWLLASAVVAFTIAATPRSTS